MYNVSARVCVCVCVYVHAHARVHACLHIYICVCSYQVHYGCCSDLIHCKLASLWGCSVHCRKLCVFSDYNIKWDLHNYIGSEVTSVRGCVNVKRGVMRYGERGGAGGGRG